MTVDWAFLAVAVPVVLFAGISKGGFGSGAAFAATPILALVMSPGQALGLMLPLLMVMDVASLRPYWRRWDPVAARLLVQGGVAGVVLGVVVYSMVDGNAFKLLIGAVALGFVAFQIGRGRGWVRLRPRPVGRAAGLVAGVVSGFTSFVSHAGGPPATVYLLLKGHDKTTFQATTVIVFWLINLIKVVPFAVLGVFSPSMLWAWLILAPVALAGTWLGVRAHHMIAERSFLLLTYALLTMTGAKLVWDALSSFAQS